MNEKCYIIYYEKQQFPVTGSAVRGSIHFTVEWSCSVCTFICFSFARCLFLLRNAVFPPLDKLLFHLHVSSSETSKGKSKKDSFSQDPREKVSSELETFAMNLDRREIKSINRNSRQQEKTLASDADFVFFLKCAKKKRKKRCENKSRG